jgi:NAD(P)-dependent dehydrogenase (short-subunit alcohol dehydrogenase family)
MNVSPARLALVTGGNRGIGLEIARQLAQQGVRVIIGARDIEKGRVAASSLAVERNAVTAIALDVTDEESVARACAEAERTHGRIDIVVNNAAILIDGPGGFSSSLFDMSDDTARRTWETNVLGPARLIKALVPGMKARGYGRVVNLSSRAGQLQHMGAGYPAYRMSKAALNALTRVAAAEAGAGNVKINAMCPGWCKTDMGGPQADRAPSEGARTAVWLAMLPESGPNGRFFHDQKEIAW